MNKLFAIACVSLSLAAAPAMAGNTTMKNAAGSKVQIKCTGGGCRVKEKAAGTKKYVLVQKTKKGGRANFEKIVATYKQQGYK